MTPQTGSALLLLVAFVLPGFVTVLLQERTFKTREDPSPFDRLLLTLYYSVWCYLLVAGVALAFRVDRPEVEALYDRYKADPAELVWRGALVILVPAVVVATATRLWHGLRLRDGTLVQSRVLGWLWINERHAQPTAWDHFFRKRRSVYVRVTTKDGSRVLGFYGVASFAAYAKDSRDLYLERVYVPDEHGWFGPESPGNQGVWLSADDAVAIEFYDPDDGAEQATAASSDPASGEGGEGSSTAATDDAAP